MNFEDKGLNICHIAKKHNDKKKKNENVNIFIANKEQLKEVNYICPEIVLTDDNEIIQHKPYQDLKHGNTRQILYVTGASGSGKSYYTAGYMREYRKMFPKNPIIIFSSLEKDKTLDDIKNTKRMVLDEKFYNTPLSIEDFKDSLVVYDDTETISNEFIQQKITNIKNLILTTGRHTNTFCLITSHNTNAGLKTKLTLLESHCITIFLFSMGSKALKYLLETSFGFDRKQIDKIKSLDSRWVTILRTNPITIMYEKGVFTM